MNHQKRPYNDKETPEISFIDLFKTNQYILNKVPVHTKCQNKNFYGACESAIFAKFCLSKTNLIIKISSLVKTMWYHKLNKNLQCDIIISMMNTYYAICLKYWRPHKYTKTTSFPIFYEFNLYYLKQNGHCYGLNVQDNVL